MAVIVPIISTFDAKGIQRAVRDFKRLKSGSDKMAFGLLNADKAARSVVGTFAKVAAVGLGATAVIGKNLVDAASALEESQSKVNVVFGASTGIIQEFATTSATAAGISKQAALEATGTYGNLFQAFGLGQEQAATMSVTLVQLAADLASFNNTKVEDAVQALRSGLSGETEPLKRFGVAINDVRLKQEALNMGLYSGSGNLTVAAKTQAAYALILKDTALAQGDFARTSDGAANQQRILAASFANVRAEIGTALLPLFKQLLSFINDSVLPVIQRFSDNLKEKGLGGAFKQLGTDLFGFITKLATANDAIFVAIGVFAALRVAVIAYTVAVNAAKIANVLFGLSLAATPIGLVVALVAAVVVGLAMLYVRFEAVRKIANPIINALIFGFEMLVNAVIGVINSFIQAANIFNGVFRAVGVNVGNLETISLVSFGRIGSAADVTATKVNRMADAFDRAEAARFGRIKTRAEEPPPPFTPPTGAVKTAAEMLKTYTDALRGVTSQQKELTRATKQTQDAQRSLANATEGVRIAQAQFNLVTRGYSVESKKAKEAQRALEDSGIRLRDATLGQEAAIRRVSQAEKALATLRAITADPESVAAAERGLEKSKFDVEEANFRVIEAERELAELRADPEANPTMIRRAEIALKEAKFQVADSVVGVRRAEESLNAERNKAATADELAEAELELDAAKRAVEDSIRAQKDATVEQAVAQAHLNEILNGATEGSDAYKDALLDLNRAKEEEAEAIDAVAEAFERERKAIVDLIDAQKELIRLQSITPPATVQKAGRILARQGELALPSQTPAALPSQAPTAGATNPVIPDYAQMFGGFTPFARGGIVTRPMMGLVGEAGPEAIIPLSQLGSGGANISITVNAGLGANGPEIGDAIVEALRRYQFRNGALVGAAQPLKVA